MLGMSMLMYLVPGHVGKLLFGLLERERRPIVLMVGRLQSVLSNFPGFY